MADARDLKSLGEDPYRFESGHKHQRFKLGLKRSENGSLAQVPLPFFGSPYAIAFRSVYVTGERNSDAHALCRHRDKASPVGVRYSGRSRGLSQMRQVVPYRRSLFRRSAMNCLSPYASLFTSCVNCIRSLRLPLAATFAKLLQALSRRRQLRSEAPGASTTDGSLALLAKIYEAASLPHIFFALLTRFSLDQTTLFTSLKLYKFPFFSSNEDLLSSLTPHLG